MKPKAPTVTEVTLKTAKGKHARKASRVTLENGCQITFVEKIPKGKAIKRARALCSRGSPGKAKK
jgi:hypothetical protein